MGNLIPFPSGALSPSGGDRHPLQKLPRAVGRALDHIEHQGVLTAAALEVDSYVTHVAMREYVDLVDGATLMAARCPDAAEGLAMLAHGFVVRANHRLNRPR